MSAVPTPAAVTFNARSSRSKQARLRRQLSTRVAGLIVVFGLALLISGLVVVKTGNQLGYSALGLFGLTLMVFLWQRWQLESLSVKPGSIVVRGVALDQVLEADLLGSIQWPASPAALWQASTSQWEGRFVASRLGVPIDLAGQLLSSAGPESGSSEVLLADAIAIAQSGHHQELDGGLIVAATLINTPAFQPVLTELKIDRVDIISVLEWQQRLKAAMASLRQRQSYGGIGRDWATGFTPTLSRYATNISHEVESGYYRHLPQVHEAVVDQLIIQLAKNRGNAALVGDLGSGKTAIVYSLAERLIKGQNTQGLDYYYIMELNASLLIASGNRVEETVLQVLGEAVQARNIIIFLDEAQLFFGSGTGSVDLSKVLLPILQQSSIKLILAFSPHDWQALSAHNGALAGLLQRLVVTQPTPPDTVKILEDAAIGIEHNSKTAISYAAIKESYRLAERYLTESAFPGKGITLLEAAANHAENRVVGPKSVQLAIESMVGAKVVGTSQAEKTQLLKLEDQIHERMVNQSHAVKVVADALRRARAGVRSPNRPVGSFLFLGPTGVGKTELARALADIYFGGQDQIIRLDMSEYQQPKDVDRLLAAGSSSAAGSNLVASIRKQPFSVVLLDEIEKSHPDILNLLLQLLDEGRLTDTDGRLVSFKDAIIICTSNAAANLIREKVGAGQQLDQFEEEITESVIGSGQFRPELINRFDELVLFRPLDKAELAQVVGHLLTEVNQHLKDQRISVELTTAATAWLVDAGYDPRLGARPMRRMVQRVVENEVAKRILNGSAAAGSIVKLDTPDLIKAAGSER